MGAIEQTHFSKENKTAQSYYLAVVRLSKVGININCSDDGRILLSSCKNETIEEYFDTVEEFLLFFDGFMLGHGYSPSVCIKAASVVPPPEKN